MGPPGVSAGNGPVCPHRGQTPRRRTLRVAQVAQKTPSGHAGRLVRRPQPPEHAICAMSAVLDDASSPGPAGVWPLRLVLLLDRAVTAPMLMRSAGVQLKMSHNAAKTCSDSRSGLPVTNR